VPRMLNHFPLFALMLRLKDSRRLPGGIHFELKDTPDAPSPSSDSHGPGSTSHIYLQSVPLSLRAMFDQYFQLGHRIRKHYLSPQVVFYLITGRFVPPIARQNLYSLQYSMLPAKRAGIGEVWNRLTERSPTRTGASPNGSIRVSTGFGASQSRRNYR